MKSIDIHLVENNMLEPDWYTIIYNHEEFNKFEIELLEAIEDFLGNYYNSQKKEAE